MYIHIYIIYKFTSEYYSQTTTSSERGWPGPGNVFSILCWQTHNYDIECSNHHRSPSTLRPKGLSRSKIKLVSHIYKFTSECHSQTIPSLEHIYIWLSYLLIFKFYKFSELHSTLTH